MQDDGCPLSAHTLDRGFTVRLTPKPGTPWRPRPKIPCEPEALAFINAAASEAQVPAAADPLTLEGFTRYVEDNVNYRHWYSGHWHKTAFPDEKHKVVFDTLIQI